MYLGSLLEFPTIIMMWRCRVAENSDQGIGRITPISALYKPVGKVGNTLEQHCSPHGVPGQVGLGAGLEEEGSKRVGGWT